MKMKKELLLRHIGKEHLIIVPNKGVVDMTKVYTLNETSSWLWQQLGDAEFTSVKVEKLLMEHYEVDAERARQDACLFIELLKQQGMIEE